MNLNPSEGFGTKLLGAVLS